MRTQTWPDHPEKNVIQLWHPLYCIHAFFILFNNQYLLIKIDRQKTFEQNPIPIIDKRFPVSGCILSSASFRPTFSTRAACRNSFNTLNMGILCKKIQICHKFLLFLFLFLTSKGEGEKILIFSCFSIHNSRIRSKSLNVRIAHTTTYCLLCDVLPLLNCRDYSILGIG